jgi:hypothetical protein
MDHAKFLRAQDVHSLNQGMDVFHLVEGVRLCWARERRLEMSRDESVIEIVFPVGLDIASAMAEFWMSLTCIPKSCILVWLWRVPQHLLNMVFV